MQEYLSVQSDISGEDLAEAAAFILRRVTETGRDQTVDGVIGGVLSASISVTIATVQFMRDIAISEPEIDRVFDQVKRHAMQFEVPAEQGRRLNG